MQTQTFKSICEDLVNRQIPFEPVEFADEALSARTADTSIGHNYDPTSSIKTLIIKTKAGHQAIILRGNDTIDQIKLKSLVGKWGVVQSAVLLEDHGFLPGTVCPVALNIPVLTDRHAKELETWCMGAGDTKRGLNIKSDQALKCLSSYNVVDISKSPETGKQNMAQNSDDLLTRRVAGILPSREGLEKLITGKKIRLYQGFDPTGGRLHLGHAIGMKKLMDFARSGHEVIFLFGTGTVLVGDPSLRDTGRKLITQAEIDENIKGWKKQVSPIVDFDKVIIKQNGDWLTKLNLKDIITIASNISATQLFKRESFTRRIEKGDPVWYHETMYPLLQGYDSVAMDVDLEIGGTDQEFNMLVGRELQKKMNGREKYVLMTPMIPGTDGKQMSKSSGNCIFLDDKPEDMYSKLMSVNDDLIATYFELLTDTTLDEIKSLDPSKPVENKKRLAYDITRQLHGTTGADAGEKFYDNVVQPKAVPADAQVILIEKGLPLLEALKVHAGLGVSNGVIKRTIEQGGVEINGKKITNPTTPIIESGTLKFGKREYRMINFIKLAELK